VINLEKIEYNKIKKELKNKTILITGGAGSVGSQLTSKILEYPIKTLRILDSNEHALFDLGRKNKDPRLRLLLGNILDVDRLELAGNNVDIVIHTAAIKNIEISEYNPIETIDTNINGTVNLIKMAMKNKPKKVLNISTDKAVNSSTLYGATKLLGERVISWAGINLNPPIKFATARFGNIFEANGNVFEVWEDEIKKKKPLSLTDKNMKRYFFHVDEAVDFILNCLTQMNQGEVFVPKMKLFKIEELASKVSKKHKIIGLRKGEKLIEELMSEDEKKNAIKKKNMWIIKQNSK
jgi:UDP-N-acetylglucosamine 4,6-dehydratase/5-epimerase